MEIKLAAIDLNIFYKKFQAVKNISLQIKKNSITSIIGPSGCGKSTLLRAFNRMNDYIPGVEIRGDVFLDGISIYKNNVDLTSLRKKVGMVFQRPNLFPLSVYDNIVYGPKIHGFDKNKFPEIVERTLKSTGLFNELKDKLSTLAITLSLEQQQRLCISRLLAVEPEVLLMDEPCSTLDPIATLKIEEMLQELKKNYTIVIVTHNMQQAARISDYTGFMFLGELIEFGKTADIFAFPKNKKTEDYITGRFG